MHGEVAGELSYHFGMIYYNGIGVQNDQNLAFDCIWQSLFTGRNKKQGRLLSNFLRVVLRN